MGQLQRGEANKGQLVVVRGVVGGVGAGSVGPLRGVLERVVLKHGQLPKLRLCGDNKAEAWQRGIAGV